MGYEIEGTIKVIMDVMTFGSGFTKREFVITSGDDRYPQDIKMEFVKDKVALLEKFRPGQRVKVGFEIRGNENNGRYYVSLNAWKIHPSDGSEAPAASGGGGDFSERPPRDFSSPPRQERGGPAGRPSSGGSAPDRRGGSGGGGGFDREKGGPRSGASGERRSGGKGSDEYGGGGGGGGRRHNAEDDDVDF